MTSFILSYKEIFIMVYSPSLLFFSLLSSLHKHSTKERLSSESQFHMDIDYIHEFPMANLSVSGYGTYFHDSVDHQYAAFMVYPPPPSQNDTEDFYVMKYLYRNVLFIFECFYLSGLWGVQGYLFQLDLATGNCQKTRPSKGHGDGQKNSTVIPWLPKMKYDGVEYAKRNDSYYP